MPEADLPEAVPTTFAQPFFCSGAPVGLHRGTVWSTAQTPLHFALQTKNWEQWDESLVTKERCAMQEGRPLALHYALHQGAPVHVLDSIIAANPDAVLDAYPGVTSNSSTALHIAAGCSAPIEVFRLLLTSCPRAITWKNGDGQLAIDLVPKGDAWRKWCRGQYKRLPQQLDREGSSPGQLQAAWHSSEKRTQRTDECAPKGYPYWTDAEGSAVQEYLLGRLKRHYRDFDSQAPDPMGPELIIHIAVSQGTTVEALAMLLDENREDLTRVLSTANHWGDLPLHTAVAGLDARQRFAFSPLEILLHETREAVACLLLNEYKDACRHRNLFGDLPLHLSFRNNEKVRAHFDEQGGQKKKDRLGVVFKGMDEGGIVRDMWPYIQNLEDNSLATKISGLKVGQELIAIGNEPVGGRSFNDVKHLVKALPVTLWFRPTGRPTTVTRRLPVVNVLKKLLDAYPDACTTQGDFGDLPLHLAVQTGGECFAATEEVLQRCEEAAQKPNELGNVPLRVAVDCFNKDEQIQQLARYDNKVRRELEDEARAEELQQQPGGKLSRLQERLLNALAPYGNSHGKDGITVRMG